MRRARAALGVAALVALAIAPAASGANRRVALSNYQWSSPVVELDLGEHVTWHWIGPDLAHSVTGDSDSSRGLDSDAGVNFPRHKINDSFQLGFSSPGTYSFSCKIHSGVNGKVIVSETPGDPVTEPDPVPAAQFDRAAPRVSKLRLSEPRWRRRGSHLELELDERARLDAEYFRLDAGGGRRFAGYERWQGFVGLNGFRFGGRAGHFRAKPGRYVALVRATDHANNISEPRKVRFTIYVPR